MKYFNQLCKKEIVDIFRECTDKDIADQCDVDVEDDDVICYFWEREDGKKYYVKKSYLFTDYVVKSMDTIGWDNLLNIKYRKCMIKKFGKDYLFDLIDEKIGLDKEYFEKVCKKLIK